MFMQMLVSARRYIIYYAAVTFILCFKTSCMQNIRILNAPLRMLQENYFSFYKKNDTKLFVACEEATVDDFLALLLLPFLRFFI